MRPALKVHRRPADTPTMTNHTNMHIPTAAVALATLALGVGAAGAQARTPTLTVGHAHHVARVELRSMAHGMDVSEPVARHTVRVSGCWRVTRLTVDCAYRLTTSVSPVTALEHGTRPARFRDYGTWRVTLDPRGQA